MCAEEAYREGVAKADMKSFDDAIQCFDRCIGLAVDDVAMQAHAYLQCALAYEKLSMPDKAIRKLQMVLQVDPSPAMREQYFDHINRFTLLRQSLSQGPSSSAEPAVDAQEYHLLIGNPGVGKSFLINNMAGKPITESSMSMDGAGVTKWLHWFQNGKVVYVDTPGLDDARSTKEAAIAIEAALRMGTLPYKVFFVLTTEAGRIRATDKALIQTVLDAAPQLDKYGVIVNKVLPVQYQALMANQQVNGEEGVREKFTSLLTESLTVKPLSVLFLPEVPSLIASANAIMPDLVDPIRQDIDTAPAVTITSNRVGALELSDETLQKMKEQLEEMEEVECTDCGTQVQRRHLEQHMKKGLKCEWCHRMMPCKNWRKHSDECSHNPLNFKECVHCKMFTASEEMVKTHVATCIKNPNNWDECEYCHLKFAFPAKHLKECPKAPVQCRHCGHNIERGKLAGHEGACDEQVVGCHQCTWPVKK